MSHFFFDMIRLLREKEEILLYANLLEIPAAEIEETTQFLQLEYKTEKLNYPYETPVFDSEAAIWAATIVYRAAQLVLYRQHAPADLQVLFPPYPGIKSPGAHLSADLTLRFLPAIVKELRHIDPDDPLIEILQHILQYWPYSAILHDSKAENADLSALAGNACLRQLCADRIIAYKKSEWLADDGLRDAVMGSLNTLDSKFWPEIQLLTRN